MFSNTRQSIVVYLMRSSQGISGFFVLCTGTKIEVPCQALTPKSPHWTDDYRAFAKKQAPRLEHRKFEGVGHFLFMEKRKEFNEALVEFLKMREAVK